jgi:hypothetical protein
VKHLESFAVTPNLLNELGTLAAPSMLAAALRAAFTELGVADSQTLSLFCYTAEFKTGARERDNVQLAIEETTGALPGDREFDVYFSKDEKIGRVGKWHLVFAKHAETHPLPYSIRLAAADGRTDSQLWRPEPAIATGNLTEDAQALLWLAGQSARSYMKRLDGEFAAGAPEVNFSDDLQTRNYGGLGVITHFIRSPALGEILHCALQYQLPLKHQPQQNKKMVFDGVLVAERDADTYLLGTFRFTVVRLNAQRVSIYPNGSTELR